MNEYPVIFTAAEVLATLDRRKTQFRRVLKPQPPPGYEPHIETDFLQGKFRHGYALWKARNPYQPGDRLWVKETYRQLSGRDWGEHQRGAPLEYKADGVYPSTIAWRSPYNTQMPRWASRITLAVTGVRIEQVQEITVEDAIAELGGRAAGIVNECGHFMEFWDSRNAKPEYRWEANPWVRVTDFEVADDSERNEGRNDANQN